MLSLPAPYDPARAAAQRRAVVLAYARRYLAAGYRLIPNHHLYRGACTCPAGAACGHAGKHPRLRRWTTTGATGDLAVVQGWLARDPYLNLGLATGQGLLALDIDPRHGGEAWRFAHLALLAPTAEQRTGGGGRHLLYRVPPPYRIKTTSRGELAAGVDTRGDGGQIIVAPSRNRHGPYRWLSGQAPWQRPPAPAPPDLVLLLTTRGILGHEPPPVTGLPPAPVLPADQRPDPQRLLQRYLAEARPGCRNASGFRLAQQLRDNGYSLAEAAPYLLAFQRAVDQPDDRYTMHEALASLHSAYGHAPRRPWPGQARGRKDQRDR